MKITNGMSDSAIANELFKRLDALRKARGISQQEMAERIGITRKSYASIGAGTCKFTTLIALLRQLD
jgi:transcriptional regulator with XRE-family HTH domain